MKILNFGSCNIDYVYTLDHIVREGETQSTVKMETFPGGKGLNQSIAIARAGAQVYHAGCIGADGTALQTLLTESGVDVSFLQTLPAKNGHAIIQVNAVGQNAIFLYAGTNEMIDKPFIDSVLAHFGAGDILLLQNEISNVQYIIDQAHGKDMRIIFNPSPYNQTIQTIDFNKLSYILLNEVEAKEISACSTPEEALAYFHRDFPRLKVVLTLGEKGCVYQDSQQQLEQAAFHVQAVDTTGAGDTFTGYFVAGLASGTQEKTILQTASAASALAVSRKGAAPSIPTKDEVLKALKTLKASVYDNRKQRTVNQIEAYLEEHIQNASLKELSSLLGYSVVYTGNLVKQLTGLPFSALLQKKRCGIAAQKLRDTNEPISEIIYSVGYENEGFLRSIFKKYYGKSPLAFRRGKNQ